ncbi:MAG: cupin domain-containing protein [Halobacteriota archaeon]|uniref:cupin domain-containing protein n=1 Tax=Natronomonas sp. TaxID=2184060 RepID=UPI00397703D1
MPERGGTTTQSVLEDPASYDDLSDWRTVPDMLEGHSHTEGTMIHKGPDRRSEWGIWTRTPGHWGCDVERAEFCHFLSGRTTLTHEDGDRIEIEPGTVVSFPEGWVGTCEVHETVRKVYM